MIELLMSDIILRKERGEPVSRVIQSDAKDNTMSKSPNLTTVIRKTLVLNGQTISNDWHLARHICGMAGTIAERAETIRRALENARKPGEAKVEFSDSKAKQFVAAWKSYGGIIDRVETLYGPSTVYQTYGAMKDASDNDKVAALNSTGDKRAENAAKGKHKGAHTAAKTRKANDEALSEALKRLASIAKSLDVTPAEALTAALDALEATIK